jgi:3-hydroxybutyryl-CoA dehydratase
LRDDNDTTAKRFQSNAANEKKDGAKRALVLSKTRTFAREDVEQFAKITGDSNPIHVRRTATDNIVHGALLVSMFPAIVGSTFPGAKYLRQTAMFRNECPVGARVTATVRKVKETRGGKIVEFETKVRCAEDEGKVYVDGFALAKIE